MIKGENDELKMSFPLESMKKIEASFHKSLWHMDKGFNMKEARKRWRPRLKGECIHLVPENGEN